MGCVVLEIFLVVFDYFSVRVFGDVSIGESDLVKDGSAVVFFRIPASHRTIEGAVADEVALDREVDKCLGDEAARDRAFNIARSDEVVSM